MAATVDEKGAKKSSHYTLALHICFCKRLFLLEMPPKKKSKVQWTAEEDKYLVKAVSNLRRQGVDVEEINWSHIANNFSGKTETHCSTRIGNIHVEGNYFATIKEVFTEHIISLDDWGSCRKRVCRDNAPNFERRHLGGGNRDPREFVSAANGALLNVSAVGDSVTTVNDDLIPIDIFGKPYLATDKAYLLPKARDDAITWVYPGCAVLGLDIQESLDNNVAQKAVLGCTTSSKKYPGIRNFLSNIVRMSNQRDLFDIAPHVLIFPIYNLEKARKWAGEGYEAIVVPSCGTVAQRIGMTNVTLGDAESASEDDINKAVELASAVCEFLAYSVLGKTEEEVNKYQQVGDVQAHKTFRDKKKIAVPRLSSFLEKPAFKISFVGHDDDPKEGHPAPDPMLLAFKSGNNWCHGVAGFRMVAVAEPEEFDDLSEEGRQNLLNYVASQAAREKSLRHNDIMERFGHEGAGVQTSIGTH